MAKSRGPARLTEAGDRPPLYDPAVHVDPNQWVFVELYCACGAIWRQRDPVSFVEPQVRDFLARHAGDGHGPACKADAVAARERVREAAFLVAGRSGEYQPKTYTNIDTACTRERPWPVFPPTDTAEQATAERAADDEAAAVAAQED